MKFFLWISEDTDLSPSCFLLCSISHKACTIHKTIAMDKEAIERAKAIAAKLLNTGKAKFVDLFIYLLSFDVWGTHLRPSFSPPLIYLRWPSGVFRTRQTRKAQR